MVLPALLVVLLAFLLSQTLCSQQARPLASRCVPGHRPGAAPGDGGRRCPVQGIPLHLSCLDSLRLSVHGCELAQVVHLSALMVHQAVHHFCFHIRSQKVFADILLGKVAPHA